MAFGLEQSEEAAPSGRSSRLTCSSSGLSSWHTAGSTGLGAVSFLFLGFPSRPSLALGSFSSRHVPSALGFGQVLLLHLPVRAFFSVFSVCA